MQIVVNKGGQRSNSGRKPVLDKKIQVYAMVLNSHIEVLGGKKAVQEIMLRAVEQAALEKIVKEE